MMAKWTTWTGSALELQRAGVSFPAAGRIAGNSAWPKSPRALAGQLRRTQTSLRVLGIEIAFTREGRSGARIIRMSASTPQKSSKAVSTVSTVSNAGPTK